MNIFMSISMIIMLMLFFSCSNDMETVSSISEEQELPIDVAKNVHITYSDSGKVKMRLSSKIMETFGGDKPYVEMPDGLRVRFYTTQGLIKSTLTANYAVSYEKTKIMEARHDVEVVNSKGEQLNTEHLVWNQRKKKIFSDVFVKITTEDKILLGEGLEADETMDNWTIRKPKGTIYLDEEFGSDKSENDTLQKN